MNDRDRIKLLATSTRLHNWLTRSRLDPADFVRRFRGQIDELLVEAVPAAKPTRRPKRQWRRWTDLNEREQTRIVLRLRRRTDVAENIETRLAKQSILTDGHEVAREINQRKQRLPQAFSTYATPKVWAGLMPRSRYRNNLRKELPDSTVAERLLAKRHAFVVKSLINNIGWHGSIDGVTFLPNLHPDDAEMTVEGNDVTALTCDRLVKAFHKLCSDSGSGTMPDGKRLESPLACQLALRDDPSGVEVYYCALLVAHRRAPPTLERAYLARAWDINLKAFRVSGRFKRAANALTAGLKLYGEGASARIHQEAAQ